MVVLGSGVLSDENVLLFFGMLLVMEGPPLASASGH